MNSRRDLVALAEPEGQHVAAAHAGVGDFADLRTGQFVDERSHACGVGVECGLEKKNCRSTCQRQGRGESPRPITIVGVDHVRSSPRAATAVTPQPCPFHLVRPHRRPPVRRVVRPLRRPARPPRRARTPGARRRRKRPAYTVALRCAGRDQGSVKVSVEGRRVSSRPSPARRSRRRRKDERLTRCARPSAALPRAHRAGYARTVSLPAEVDQQSVAGQARERRADARPRQEGRDRRDQLQIAEARRPADGRPRASGRRRSGQRGRTSKA